MSATSEIGVSIVVEWENALTADDVRPRCALAELARQTAALAERCEVLFLHNPAQVSRDEIAAVVAPYLRENRTAWRIEAAPGLHYYDLKNAGARRARGAIVVFTDSDIVVEPGWLAAITAPFAQAPEITLVAGNTYLDTTTLAGKAMAEGWIFPPRSNSDALTTTSFFLANNVALRRDFLLAHPFPPMPAGATRGACVVLTRQLHAEGVTIWLASGARANHPAPKNLKRVLIRALAEGRDWALNGGLTPGSAALGHGLRYAAKTPRDIAHMIRATRAAGARIGLTGPQAALTALLQCAYCALRPIGAFAAILWPAYARQAWRI